MKTKRAKHRVLAHYHDSVVHVKGGARFAGCGRKIKPMTLELAAESAGMKPKDFHKRIDPNQQERPFLESWICNLMDGMDKASLDTLEHELGRMVFTLPAELPDAEMVGDVMREVFESTRDDSEKGKELSSKERQRIAVELREMITEVCVMLAVVEGEG